MEQREEDKPSAQIGHFQDEGEEVIEDYAPVESPHPEIAKKPTQLLIQPTSEPNKKTVTLTLEDQLIGVVWLEEKTLKNMGLKGCDGFFRNKSHHFFKDSKSTIYFFEKNEEKDQYKLFFIVSPYGKG